MINKCINIQHEQLLVQAYIILGTINLYVSKSISVKSWLMMKNRAYTTTATTMMATNHGHDGYSDEMRKN